MPNTLRPSDFLGISLPVFGFLLLFSLPVVVGGLSYNDDHNRILYGYYNWLPTDGRFFGEFMMRLLMGGSPVLDISPLPLLLGLATFALAAALLYRVVFHDIQPVFFVLMMVSFASYPFFLQAISYKLDVLLVFVSIALILCAVALGTRRPWALAGGSILLLCSLASYQSNISMFPMLVLGRALHEALSRHAVDLRNPILSTVQFAVAVVVYTVVVNTLIGGTPAARGDLADVASASGLATVVENARAIFAFTDQFLWNSKAAYALIVLGTFVLLANLALFWRRYTGARDWRFYLLFGILTLSPALLLLFFLGPLSVLETTRLRARTILPASGVIVLMTLTFYYLRSIRFVAYLLLGLAILSNVSLSYLYGNARILQEHHDQALMRALAEDAAALGFDEDPVTVWYIGRAPRHEQVERVLNERRALAHIMPRNFGNFSYSSSYMRLHGFPVGRADFGLSPTKMAALINETRCSTKLERNDYWLTEYEDTLIIDFSKRICPDWHGS